MQSKPIGKQADRKASRKLCNSYVIYQKYYIVSRYNQYCA